MSLLTAWAYLTLAAPEPTLVATYQSLGVEPSVVSAIGDGFRAAVSDFKLAPLDTAETERVARSATMCGEDAACLATVGQRSGARFVLAFGVGKVGASLLLSALFVDVTQGKELARASRRVPESMPEWPLVTRSLADDVLKVPVEPLVVQVPIEVVKPVKPHTFRPWAFVTLGVAVAFAIVAGAVGLGAWGNYNLLKMSPTDTRLRDGQRALNASADACLVLSAIAGVASIAFFILDRVEKPVVVNE